MTLIYQKECRWLFSKGRENERTYGVGEGRGSNRKRECLQLPCERAGGKNQKISGLAHTLGLCWRAELEGGESCVDHARGVVGVERAGAALENVLFWKVSSARHRSLSMGSETGIFGQQLCCLLPVCHSVKKGPSNGKEECGQWERIGARMEQGKDGGALCPLAPWRKTVENVRFRTNDWGAFLVPDVKAPPCGSQP